MDFLKFFTAPKETPIVREQAERILALKREIDELKNQNLTLEKIIINNGCEVPPYGQGDQVSHNFHNTMTGYEKFIEEHMEIKEQMETQIKLTDERIKEHERTINEFKEKFADTKSQIEMRKANLDVIKGEVFDLSLKARDLTEKCDVNYHLFG
ncbi:uncharacterized protein LOC109602279 [Aethina tumida]|uniref:uncharacterized protein LOC109602279 n=1 Tax=Aethina tumida TaxID=116153 RepID=UPI002148C0D8|nr:uncharacterized protein LOC109602279 [Aethina tumida]XP_049823376.1 uncharacterized protein LOC109602279 [Aethina tumida]XP_049823377.1 uncharacterized protein LOC109602279 [Aethina tumida]XP_049823378.1 uncharacterized protein LOC109602279 [Aethina tumida]XP_049823379.1 uncharacterized protein LOC109602279 [Aethina tumida]XP_049823380.1 uncharacterized protein LOC109602279 [Aethina tumida]